MSSYQTVTLVWGSPPPAVNHPLSSRVGGTQFCWHTLRSLAWPGISNINPLFDYLQSQLGPSGVSVTSCRERERASLKDNLLKMKAKYGNKPIFRALSFN